jgi:hypothetical protein
MYDRMALSRTMTKACATDAAMRTYGASLWTACVNVRTEVERDVVMLTLSIVQGLCAVPFSMMEDEGVRALQALYPLMPGPQVKQTLTLLTMMHELLVTSELCPDGNALCEAWTDVVFPLMALAQKSASQAPMIAIVQYVYAVTEFYVPYVYDSFGAVENGVMTAAQARRVMCGWLWNELRTTTSYIVHQPGRTTLSGSFFTMAMLRGKGQVRKTEKNRPSKDKKTACTRSYKNVLVEHRGRMWLLFKPLPELIKNSPYEWFGMLRLALIGGEREVVVPLVTEAETLLASERVKGPWETLADLRDRSSSLPAGGLDMDGLLTMVGLQPKQALQYLQGAEQGPERTVTVNALMLASGNQHQVGVDSRPVRVAYLPDETLDSLNDLMIARHGVVVKGTSSGGGRKRKSVEAKGGRRKRAKAAGKAGGKEEVEEEGHQEADTGLSPMNQFVYGPKQSTWQLGATMEPANRALVLKYMVAMNESCDDDDGLLDAFRAVSKTKISGVVDMLGAVYPATWSTTVTKLLTPTADFQAIVNVDMLGSMMTDDHGAETYVASFLNAPIRYWEGVNGSLQYAGPPRPLAACFPGQQAEDRGRIIKGEVYTTLPSTTVEELADVVRNKGTSALVVRGFMSHDDVVMCQDVINQSLARVPLSSHFPSPPVKGKSARINAPTDVSAVLLACVPLKSPDGETWEVQIPVVLKPRGKQTLNTLLSLLPARSHGPQVLDIDRETPHSEDRKEEWEETDAIVMTASRLQRVLDWACGGRAIRMDYTGHTSTFTHGPWSGILPANVVSVDADADPSHPPSPPFPPCLPGISTSGWHVEDNLFGSAVLMMGAGVLVTIPSADVDRARAMIGAFTGKIYVPVMRV